MLVPVSTFQILDYCEYQLFLKYYEKVKPVITRKMLAGIQKHKRLEEEFLEEAEEIEETIEEHLEKLLRGEVSPFNVRELPVKSEKHGLIGRIDEALFYEDHAVIIDDKPNPRITQGTIDQLRAYAAVFEDHFNWENLIVLKARSHSNNEVFYEEEFNEKARTQIIEKIEYLHWLMQDPTRAKPTSEKEKCLHCSYGPYCDKFMEE